MTPTLNVLLWRVGGAIVSLVIFLVLWSRVNDENTPVWLGAAIPAAAVFGLGIQFGVALYERLRSRPLEIYRNARVNYRYEFWESEVVSEGKYLTWELWEEMSKDKEGIEGHKLSEKYSLADDLEEFANIRKWNWLVKAKTEGKEQDSGGVG